MTTREAKEYLIAQIIAEAAKANSPLDDVERRMLYFTETAWMPEGTWSANEIFNREYDEAAFEYRIADLVSRWKSNPQHDLRQWNEAVACLRSEDHYLLILINPALQTAPPPQTITWRVKYIIVGISLGALTILALFAWHSLH